MGFARLETTETSFWPCSRNCHCHRIRACGRESNVRQYGTMHDHAALREGRQNMIRRPVTESIPRYGRARTGLPQYRVARIVYPRSACTSPVYPPSGVLVLAVPERYCDSSSSQRPALQTQRQIEFQEHPLRYVVGFSKNRHDAPSDPRVWSCRNYKLYSFYHIHKRPMNLERDGPTPWPHTNLQFQIVLSIALHTNNMHPQRRNCLSS